MVTTILFAAPQIVRAQSSAQDPVHITHEYTNTDAQSLIGLPMGTYKTVITKQGNLRWSHWNLKNKPLDSPFGFADQLDGELGIDATIASPDATPFKVAGQSLYKGRYPFVVTKLAADALQLEELAFASAYGRQAIDVVRLQCTNPGNAAATVEIHLSGKQNNLPGHVTENYFATQFGYDSLITRNGYEIATFDPDKNELKQVAWSVGSYGLTLRMLWKIPAGATETLWLKLPKDAKYSSTADWTKVSGPTLLAASENMWDAIWKQGVQFELPEKELDDFFYSSLAYVLILTERDNHGDLWVLDGPTGYVQYWGRGEYFQARALEISGHLATAEESIEHAFHIQMSDGEWDGPPIAGWPAWDNMGGNAAAAWDYYLYTRNRQWLAEAYPHLLAAALWIRDHREESELDQPDLPAAAKPINRSIPWSCRPETSPTLLPGEKPYWYGLLPWAYGDSGLPEGHAYAHNFFALYAVKVALNAAEKLGRQHDAAALAKEYADYKAAILSSIDRSIALEKDPPPYLPAMPTNPEAAYSQSFVAVYPTQLYAPDDPLISGLLTRMERGEQQGLPTNMAWMGAGGVWPGESMNVAETYLLRGDVTKTVDLLLATLNHSYYTNVWKEEIRVDKTRPRACLGEKKGENQEGTGDMPEAWGNANLVNLLRDMLLQERNDNLVVMAGIPANWIQVGQEIALQNTPVTLGGSVSFKLRYASAGKMLLNISRTASSAAQPSTVTIHFPIDTQTHTITGVLVNGKPVKQPAAAQAIVKLAALQSPTTVEVDFH
jgi:GH15 family glucan-1,4-alpha-glucosidase